MHNLTWSERAEGGATIWSTSYLGHLVEVTVRPFSGEFAATAAYISPHGAWQRDHKPTWGKTAEQALKAAQRAVLSQVGCEA